MEINIDTSSLEVMPFCHFVALNVISAEDQGDILTWLEESAPWKLTKTNFYEQYEFSLLQQDFPAPISLYCSKDFLNHLRHQVSEIFSVRLEEHVDVTAHKLLCGQTIRIHNDFIPGEETHRVLLQLNRGWSDDFGGYLMLFSDGEPEDISKIIPPLSGSVQGFAISKDSHHAVSTVHGGERYTIVYSFYSSKPGRASKDASD